MPRDSGEVDHQPQPHDSGRSRGGVLTLCSLRPVEQRVEFGTLGCVVTLAQVSGYVAECIHETNHLIAMGHLNTTGPAVKMRGKKGMILGDDCLCVIHAPSLAVRSEFKSEMGSVVLRACLI